MGVHQPYQGRVPAQLDRLEGEIGRLEGAVGYRRKSVVHEQEQSAQEQPYLLPGRSAPLLLLPVLFRI